MIYVNQSWKKKKKVHFNAELFIHHLFQRSVEYRWSIHPTPVGKKKKVHKPSMTEETEEKFRDTDTVHGIHAPLSPPQKYELSPLKQ